MTDASSRSAENEPRTGQAGIPYTFKIASEAWELEQIPRLNYQTFVEEIPQHPPNPEYTLLDRFHCQNTYLVCVSPPALLGMVAVRSQRPFSLDAKLANLETFLPAGHSLCEIRLLAIRPEHRRRRILVGLVDAVARYCQEQGYTLAVISGTVRQLKLYRHMGFVPFGPLVGTPQASFQPMYLTAEAFWKQWGRRFDKPEPLEGGSVEPVAGAVDGLCATLEGEEPAR